MDLEKLKKEIREYLEKRGVAVFHGLSRLPGEQQVVIWDFELHPDFKEFVTCASALGIKVMHMHERILTQDSWDDIETSLETFELPATAHTDLSRRLKALAPYIGFLAGIELTFDFESRLYIFEARAEFFNEFLELDDEVSLYEVPDFMKDAPMGDEDDDDEPRRPTGFFSRN
ncbi:MAG: hypothetical protein FJW30_10070 [Acidobacteria bacterium]|nr:hypothetical protein [Acidobacteriota bacterium]